MAIGDRFEEVLAAARLGERGAFETIYRDLAPLVLGYLRSNRARDPEDLTSEVFIAVVRNLGSFTGNEKSFRSWVLTITHRRLIDDFRHQSRRPEDPTLPDDVQARMEPTDETPETEVLDLLATQSVHHILDSLTEDQRAVITLRILGDMPIKEVAAILDKPETAVKSLQHRALATLARHLEGPEESATHQYPPDRPGR